MSGFKSLAPSFTYHYRNDHPKSKGKAVTEKDLETIALEESHKFSIYSSNKVINPITYKRTGEYRDHCERKLEVSRWINADTTKMAVSPLKNVLGY